MTQITADLNRPVHLARRDAFFECAMDILSHSSEALPPEQRLGHVERIHDALRHARYHAHFASQSERALPREIEFHHFLELKLQNVASAMAMLRHQLEFEQEEGFLSRFLDTPPGEGLQPARQYQRRAEDILQGLWNMLRLAHAQYFELRQKNISALPPDEQSRYHRAYAAAGEDARRKTTGDRIFGPTPETP